MKKLFVACGLAWAGLGALAYETVTIPTLPAPGIVDGDLADASWKKAYATKPFTASQPGKTITEETVAWLYADEANLYVGVKCSFADYALREKIIADSAKLKSGFAGDCVEIFVDPGDTGNAAHIAVNVAGELTAFGLVAPIRSMVQLHKSDWTAEVAIPFSSIKLSGTTFSPNWRVNVARGNYKKGECSSWSKLENGAFFDLPAFNVVKGIQTDLVAVAKAQKAAARKDFEIALDRIVYTDQPAAKVTLDYLTDKSIAGYTVQVKVLAKAKDGDKNGDKTVYAKSEALKAFRADLAIPLAGFADGKYEATFTIADAAGKAVCSDARTFYKIPPMKDSDNTERYTVRNHCIYKNGAFHFPIITWCCSYGKWESEEQYVRELSAMFSEMRDCGFTANMTSMANFPEEDIDALAKVGAWKRVSWEQDRFKKAKAAGWSFETYCKLAKEHGLSIIAQSPYLWRSHTPYAIDRFVDHVSRIRKASNVMCWHTSDEQDGRVEDNERLNRLYHEIDPTRFTWINTINGVAANKYAADVISSDPYPIPNGTVTAVAAHADRLVENSKGRPGVGRWIWIQNFGGEGSWTRPPTPDEVKCMAMLAVNHGVTGIAYFNWCGPKGRNGTRQHKDGTAMYPAFNAHLRKWTPALCQGKVVFRGRQGVLDVLAVTFEGKKVLSVVNVENKPVQDAPVKIDGFCDKKITLGGYGTSVEEL